MALSPSRTSQYADVGTDPLAGPTVPVLVVTVDDSLWMRLSAAIPGLRLEQFDDAADLVARWNPSRPAVVLVDGRPGDALGAAAERVQTHSVALVAVAIVDEATLPAAVALERQKALFDHVATALEPGATLAVIERAGEEALARAAVVPPGVSPSVAGPARGRTPPPSRAPWIAGGVALAVVAVGGVWLVSTQDPKPAPADGTNPAAPAASAPTAAAAPTAVGGSAPAAPETPATAAVEELERLLARARAAMRDKRYIEPATDNALEHFRDALAVDAQNGEARQGLERIAELLVGRAESSLAAREYPAALRALEVVRSLNPQHPRLAALDAQVNERLRDVAVAQVQAAVQANAFDRANALLRQAERTGNASPAQLAQLRQELARRQQSAASAELARLAQARIAQGRLNEPANDSARHYLGQLQALERPELADTLARLQRDYARRAGNEARAAAQRGATAEAEGWVADVRSVVGAAAAAQLARDLAAAAPPVPRGPDPARVAQLAQERLAAQRLLAPENDSAVHHYRSLQTLDPRHPALPGLRDALGTALLDQARGAYAAGRGAEAQAALDAAREFGVPASALAAVQAAAEAPKAPVAARMPRLLKALSPAYPARAAQDGIEGWADVEFVIDVDGEPTNVRAVASQPNGVFESAAVAAVRRARFEPARTADGTAMPMPSRLRVRFDLRD